MSQVFYIKRNILLSKRKVINLRIKTGEKIGAFCLSEPGNGSDAGAASTMARRWFSVTRFDYNGA